MVYRQHVPGEAGHPLTIGQEALWFIQELVPDCAAYNVAGAVTLHSTVDVDRLAAAVSRVLSSHRLLHAVFRAVDGTPRRFAGPAGTLEVYDVPGDDDAVRRFATDLVQTPFRLAARPAVRVALLRRGDDDVLLITAHHIILDDVSQVVLLFDILDEYAAAGGGDPHTPADDGSDFDAYLVEQERFIASPRAAASGDHWRRELAAVPGYLELPTDHPRPAVHQFVGAELRFDLPPELLAGVRQAASRYNTTPFAVLLSAFQLVLFLASGQTRFIVGYPTTQRSFRRYRRSIGYFVNSLPLCTEIDLDGPFDQLVRRTGEKLLSGLLHRQYPFALMPRLTSVRRNPSQAGLLPVMFVMNTDTGDELSAAILPGRRVERAGVAMSRFDVPQQLGQFDLTMHVMSSGLETLTKIKYNTSLFTEQTAARLAERYVAVLAAAADGTLPPTLRDVR
ncbi:condensation domain-containing protein [Dactylosporangium sp. NPDC048998]|uniref:condensation domain-containing protein n=1 Tax=Dactylosporangium sp. NPDC048998 TaxID=3363976 RepID=UPI003723755D